MGSLGQAHTLAGENPLPRLRLRGLDLTRQVVPGASFGLSVPIDSAWPDRFLRFLNPVPTLSSWGVNDRLAGPAEKLLERPFAEEKRPGVVLGLRSLPPLQ